MNKLMNVLIFLVFVIALTFLLWEVVPVKYDYDFFYKTYASNLKPLIIGLPYIGLIASVVMFFKQQKREKYVWLFVLSLFSILYPFRMHAIQYINTNYHTNIAINPQSGITPLSYAVDANDTSRVIALLEHGANPNEKIPYRNNYILIAAQKSNIEMLEALMEHGAAINTMSEGKTALHVAAKNNNLRLVEFLLAKGAKTDIRSENFDKKARPFDSINPKSQYGKTPLFIAVDNDNIDIARLLLNAKANPNINDHCKSMMYSAVENNNTAMVKLLLDHHANTDVQSHSADDMYISSKQKSAYGKTPIILAVEKNNYEITERLVNAHADLSITDFGGKSVFDYTDNVEMKHLLSRTR